MGRRDAESLFVDVSKPQVRGQQGKSSKRRLFGGVLNRFEKSDNSSSRSASGGGGVVEDGRGGGPVEPGHTESSSSARKWSKPGHSKTSQVEGAAAVDRNLTESASMAALKTVVETADSGEASAEGTDGAAGIAVKASKGVQAPDHRFARFLGKMLGVKDDAVPDRPSIGSGGAEDIVDAGDNGVPAEAREESKADQTVADARTTTTATESTRNTATTPTGTTTVNGGASSPAAAEFTPVTATAVFPAMIVSADAMPVAVAVALPMAGATAAGSDPVPPSRRPSRSSRTHRASASAGRAREESGVGTGETVLISDWVTSERRDSGGQVRVFSAQRMLEGKVQKRCRIAISPKNMTQVRYYLAF